MAGSMNGVRKATGRVGSKPKETAKFRASRRANTLIPPARSSSISPLADQKLAQENGIASSHTEEILAEPYGAPPVWAETRIELSEALPWFRAVQGGCYYFGGICRGILVDGDCGDRSYIDDEIVITRVGGSCGKDADGALVQKKDHDPTGAILRSLTNSMRCEIPIGIIIGGKNSVCRTKVPHKYNVMGFFRITDIWFEKVGRFSGAKLRFEKLDLDTKSWWAAKEAAEPVPLEDRESVSEGQYPVCEACSKASPQVYAEGWVCLHPTCVEFWKLDGLIPPSTLTYSPKFLKKRSRQTKRVRPPHSLAPDLLSTFRKEDADIASARVAWKGIVCPLCRRCISRKYWRGWVCETSGCDFQYEQHVHRVSLRSVLPEPEMGAYGHPLPYFGKEGTVIPNIEYMRNYRKDTFELPGVGVITHFAANTTVNSRPGGPNDLFRQLQLEDLGLRRYPITPSPVTGTLTSHFAVNYGMPYKYAVSVASLPFNTAPQVILSALGRLTWATSHTVKPEEFQKPNELLALGYFEDMSIGYHDDGESSLGPTIATLSLGGPATMSIRMKDQYFNGFRRRDAKKVIMDNDPVLAGCAKYEQRVELARKFQNNEISAKQYKDAREELSRSITKREASAICTMELNHGDLVVMHGPDLQKYYEHSVVPSGKLRFALTARYVKPDQVSASEHWKGDFTPDPEFEYDGDE